MSASFVVLVVSLGAIAATALFTRSDVARALIVSTILVSGFLVPYAVDRALAHSQLREADAVLLTDTCRPTWIAALDMAHERLRWDARIMFLANAVLAVIAVAPRRKKK